jgi:hypothetical protein
VLDDTALEQMLIETIGILESCNLTELLPVNVLGWYDQRKIEAEDEFSPAHQFIQDAARKLYEEER